MDITLRVPALHITQKKVLQTSKQFNVLCCGRRWGKTVIGIDRVITSATQHRRKFGWFAPTYKLLGDAWRELDQVLEPLISRRDAADHRMEFKTGSSLECWTLDKPDAGRSRSYHEVVIDEAAMVTDLKDIWEKAIMPTLTDYDGGAWFLSTPTGIASHFHTLFQLGQDPQNPRWASWQMPTSANPYMKPEVIERFREDLTDLAFAQEYLAQFVTWAGAVFRRIQDAAKRMPASPSPAAMIGVDWGRTGDYTVFVAVSGKGEVVAMDRFRGIEYAIQRARLGAFWQRLGSRAHIIAETNSMGAPVVEQLQRDGLPVFGFNTTNSTKCAIIQALALAFEQGQISIPNDPVLIGELQAFEGKPLASGLIRYAAPQGLHDDTVMALAMAWAGLLLPQDRQLFIDSSTGQPNERYSARAISPI